MTNRKDIFSDGEYYHIYNRGNTKQKIFTNDFDYSHFEKLLYLCNTNINFNFRDDIIRTKINAYDFERGQQIVSIGAWVLMPNHFHLYITPCPRCHLGEMDVIAYFMQKLCTSYSMYFNRKHERVGKLFEGVFQSKHVEDDEYAKYIFSYIHLNPVKLINPTWKDDGIKNIRKTLDFLNKFSHSSYQDYNGVKRRENKILSPKDFPEYFSDSRIFKNEIFDWLSYNDGFDSDSVA